jgi:2-oxoglutarate ferredoxin oxidoreductase subunit beta
MGSLDFPFNPLSLAIGAEATFVARCIDTDKKAMTEVLRAAAQHKGTAFVEIFQNCPIFNDDAWQFVRDDKDGVNRIYLRSGEPIRWGADLEKGLRQRSDGSIEICAADDPDVLVHDPSHEGAALSFALSRVTQESHGGTPVGVFRDIRRPVYDELMSDQLVAATEKRGAGDLAELLHSGETWTIS